MRAQTNTTIPLPVDPEIHREPILFVKDLSVSFDGFQALNVEEFSLYEKELRVVIGPNGAGKTTFLDVLCGKTRP